MTDSDRIRQLESEIAILKDNLLNYICQATPKDPNPQWTEERLRVLERDKKVLEHTVRVVENLQIKVHALESKQNPELYNADR